MKEFTAWGPVNLDREVYVRRPLDDAYVASLLRDEHVHLVGCRQVGKTSMMLQAERVLNDKGVRACHIDLDALAGDVPPEMVSSILLKIAAKLGVACVATYDLIDGLRDLASAGSGSLVILLDEFDRLRTMERGTQVVAALRAAQQAMRVAPPTDPLSRVVLSVAAIRVPAAVAGDRGPQSTELEGKCLPLGDFVLDDGTVDQLIAGFPEDLHAVATNVVSAALRFSGGYPMLCTWLCRRLIEQNVRDSADLTERLEAFVVEARNLPKEKRQFLDSTARFFITEPRPFTSVEALSIYRTVLRQLRAIPFDPQDPAHDLLVVSGLTRVAPQQVLRPRAPFLRAYFDDEWARDLHSQLQQASARSFRPPTHVDELKRVAVLTTGGTIGMVEMQDHTVGAPADLAELAQQYAGLERLVSIDWRSVGEPLDSANVGPSHWTRMTEMIHELKRDHGYAGVVVAHGTDTLAHSASAVAFALGKDLTFPVVFTGSQTTVDVPHGDARSNLWRAAMVATHDIPEVVVCFDEFVLRAVRVTKRDDRRFNAFESPTYPPLATIAEQVQVNTGLLRNVDAPQPLEPKATFVPGILSVFQIPGLYSSFYEAALDDRDATGERRCRGVLLQTLGAGNIPTLGEFTLEPLLSAAAQRDIPVVLVSAYPIDIANTFRYAPSLAAVRAGAIFAGNITVPAATAKLSWVLAQFERSGARGSRVDYVRERIRADYVGEMGQKPEELQALEELALSGTSAAPTVSGH